MTNTERYLKVVEASDPKEVRICRGAIRELLQTIEGLRAATPDDMLGDGTKALIAHVEKEVGFTQAAEDRKFLNAYLHFNGSKHDELSEGAHNHLMSLCDGYGVLSVAELREKGLLWDWSHVRDSTPEALARARLCLETGGSSETSFEEHNNVPPKYQTAKEECHVHSGR